MAFLAVQNISRHFGGVRALNDVSFKVDKGGITAIIGPNGAGKTTLFNIISGVQRPDNGTILFNGKRIDGVPPYKIARHGIARTFQNVTLFSRLTVLENVMIGCHCSARSGMMSAALRLPWQQREERRLREQAREQLALAGIADLAEQPAGILSFGQRRMVEWARVMVMEPQLLLLDEPASGLNMNESEALADSIRAARDRGVTILLVEHDMSLVMNVADQLVVLDFGTLVASGVPAEVQRNPEVIKIYLGGAGEEPC